MKRELIALANAVREAVAPHMKKPTRKVVRRGDSGDPHFFVDEVAEQTVFDVLSTWKIPLAYLSEDRGLVRLHERPEILLIIDPIDGTRPAMACFESACFSVAVVPYSERPKFGQVRHALVSELKSGDWYYAGDDEPGVSMSKSESANLSEVANLSAMFWSLELTAHPVDELMKVYGHMVDGSVTRGAVFVYTSSSFSLTRIVSGQLDAHVDVGHRILTDDPALMSRFLEVGRGKAVTLFPYDIAGGAFIASRAGAVVTDAYGAPLDDLQLLTDKSLESQCSIVCAANRELHTKIMKSLRFQKGANGCVR